jgi:hypothetical protein
MVCCHVGRPGTTIDALDIVSVDVILFFRMKDTGSDGVTENDVAINRGETLNEFSNERDDEVHGQEQVP